MARRQRRMQNGQLSSGCTLLSWRTAGIAVPPQGVADVRDQEAVADISCVPLDPAAIPSPSWLLSRSRSVKAFKEPGPDGVQNAVLKAAPDLNYRPPLACPHNEVCAQAARGRSPQGALLMRAAQGGLDPR
eukprot:6266067-Pyramimonas_sp.AAC.2